MKSDREKAQEDCELIGHVWEKQYYGFMCLNCKMFVPEDYFDDPFWSPQPGATNAEDGTYDIQG
jgi:hypothetical protein